MQDPDRRRLIKAAAVHAYAMDYGAKPGAYVDAFMKTINGKFADGLYARASA